MSSEEETQQQQQQRHAGSRRIPGGGSDRKRGRVLVPIRRVCLSVRSCLTCCQASGRWPLRWACDPRPTRLAVGEGRFPPPLSPPSAECAWSIRRLRARAESSSLHAPLALTRLSSELNRSTAEFRSAAHDRCQLGRTRRRNSRPALAAAANAIADTIQERRTKENRKGEQELLQAEEATSRRESGSKQLAIHRW